MHKASLKIMAIISFFIIPSIMLFLPAYKIVSIASVEFLGELYVTTWLVQFCMQSRRNKNIDWSVLFLCISMIFVFCADTLNSARLLKIVNCALVSDCLYSGFAFFLSVFLLIKLGIFERKLKEWGWIFLIIFLTDAYLSYHFLLAPYFLTNVTMAWRISASIYMGLTVFIVAVTLPFAFRVVDRKIFWFLNFIILLLLSDFAIRYQDAFVDTTTFSWAEMGWCSAFIGLSWLLHFSRNQDVFACQSFVLSPFVSIRSLLTLFIGGANTLFLISILSVKLFVFQNAIDISSMLLLLFLFWSIANEFSIWLANDLSSALKHMFKSREHLSSDGMVQFNLERVATKNAIFEISKILDSYNELAEQTNKMMKVVVDTNKKASMAEVAFQVSHDIRSPLAALDMAVTALPELSEEIRLLIRSSIGRIKDIANNLIQKNPKNVLKISPKVNSVSHDDINSIQLLSSLIDRIISEKRMQFRSKIGIEIDSTLDESAYGIFSEINTREFMRLLSNLINNAVEALVNSGRVTISLTQVENYAVISITDNGCGISPEIINIIGQRGESFGKEGGSGLGLYHARKTVESWKGYLKINSKPNAGTTINVMLPLVKAAFWFVERLHVYPNSRIVVLDDDVSIHQIWNGRFEKMGVKNYNVEILHLSAPNELSSWMQANDTKTIITLFLIDHEFLGYDEVGLDIIEKLEIQSQSILVTSHFEEIGLRARCERLGVQLIPKDMAAFVPISIEAKKRVDAILIDDDTLVHQCWTHSADIKKKTLALFLNAEDFIKVSQIYAQDIPVYVDVSLADGVRGEAVAMQLSELGFCNVYLATGYEADNFKDLSFIKGVIDKYPPF